jgi:hypothetical protein
MHILNSEKKWKYQVLYGTGWNCAWAVVFVFCRGLSLTQDLCKPEKLYMSLKLAFFFAVYWLGGKLGFRTSWRRNWQEMSNKYTLSIFCLSMNVHWKKSSKGKPELKFEEAFRTIFIISKCFQRSEQKHHINCFLELGTFIWLIPYSRHWVVPGSIVNSFRESELPAERLQRHSLRGWH